MAIKSMVAFVDHCPRNGSIYVYGTLLYLCTRTCVAVLFMYTCVAVFLTCRGGLFTLEYKV